MKRIIVCTAATALLLASGAVSAQVVGSKHDITTNGNFDNAGNTSGQVCVYCHTPHNATGVGGPIWNRTNSSAVYTMYGTTQAGTSADSTPGAQSLSCLGCHDGTVAVDSILNIPGDATSWTSNNEVITGYALVGSDLSDDHPVSIAYNEGLAGLKASNTTGMPLYSNNVECATCHDVHNTTGFAQFLRVTAGNSDICTACHDR